jgi:hypothetical protein
MPKQRGEDSLKLQPCQCGCGEFPKKASSRFLPGHDLRKAYKDSGVAPRPTK